MRQLRGRLRQSLWLSFALTASPSEATAPTQRRKGWESSGGAVYPAASALFKPDVQISRIRLTRILSVRGMHSESAMRRSQEPQAEALQMGVKRLAFRGPVGALTPTLQVTRQAEAARSGSARGSIPGDSRDGSIRPSLSASG